MTEPEKYYQAIVQQIEGVKESKMFGAKCIKTPNGKAAAMYWKDGIVVKLTKKDENEILAMDGINIFTPMEKRPMNGWVQVPYSNKELWNDLIKKAVEYVKDLPSK
ncbi:MAG: hypothetical protein SFY32_06085 [Bacteroidota bacterium]|nr:hypothetical protein [Bacteroidota bacterium]